MRLEGSCHCRTVRFSLQTRNPVPYQRCYCSICRKTNGGGGFAVNIAGDYESLEVEGKRHIRAYQAVLRQADGTETRSEAQRMFCAHCGSGLWLYDERWPELVHPFASVIDTPLPAPPERTHLMLDHAPDWVQPEIRTGDRRFGEYPEESIAEWHRRTNTETT